MNYLFVVLFVSLFSCKTEYPTKFSETVLQDTFTSINGDSVAFGDVLKAHEGKTIVIDVWASWCKDCIQGMPKVKDLQKDNPDVVFVFLSLDRGEDAWKRGIKKYDVQGEHYYLPKGKKSAFGDFVDIDWIPRYMVVDSNGSIKVFKAIEADNNQIIEALK
ncbi:TlpA family protein disulfide reductase [Cognatitamlana onchidii]|uniref:TlpA family protein disulfide reductase n=1 Tax=Cognatitamlana onchidii TaxID=2562860 RepID=UPI001F2EBB92|nr:thioredoxin family protein [Algibacter onchidii]